MTNLFEVVILIVEGATITELPAALYRAEARMPDNAGVEAQVHDIASGEKPYSHKGEVRYACLVVTRAVFDAAIAEAVQRDDYVVVGCDDDCEEPLVAIIGPSTWLGPVVRALAPAGWDADSQGDTSS